VFTAAVYPAWSLFHEKFPSNDRRLRNVSNRSFGSALGARALRRDASENGCSDALANAVRMNLRLIVLMVPFIVDYRLNDTVDVFTQPAA
jgi:hypothetical protein